VAAVMDNQASRTANKTAPAARALPALDGYLLTACAGLIALGLVMVASSSFAVAQDANMSPFYYLIRHVVALGIGLGLAVLLFRIPLEEIEKRSLPLFIFALGLLVLPWIPGLGVRVNGALRWIRLGITNFQVVETAKLLMVVYLAGYCVRQRQQLFEQWKGILKPLGMVGIMVLMLLPQPDFGSAVLILSVCFTLLWLAGARASYLTVLMVLGVLIMAAIAVSEPYRLQRFVGFLDPWKDPYASGFQLTQALIAIGRGNFFGVGLGESVQKLHYLPEAHSDFIVAVIAEELGFFGLILVIGLFCLFTWRAFELGARALQQGFAFAGFVAYGIALWFSMQAVVSIGVNLGLLPTKGLTLPLISSGGSSMMMTVAALGLLFNIGRRVALASQEAQREPKLGSKA
jgi:cell division protein FtsW